jgi:hypothetical protein
MVSCGHTTRSLRKGREGSLVVLLLAERARSECARSMRAIEDQPGCPPRTNEASTKAMFPGFSDSLHHCLSDRLYLKRVALSLPRNSRRRGLSSPKYQ